MGFDGAQYWRGTGGAGDKAQFRVGRLPTLAVVAAGRTLDVCTRRCIRFAATFFTDGCELSRHSQNFDSGNRSPRSPRSRRRLNRSSAPAR
jgi:hypothetical protein